MGDEEKPQVDHLNLKVVTQDGNEIFFKCAAVPPPPPRGLLRCRICALHALLRLAHTRLLRFSQVQEDDRAQQAHERLLQ